MKQQWFSRGLATLGLIGLCALPAGAYFDETINPSTNNTTRARSGVQRLNADPSPAPAESNINNYINQDEQLNLTPRDGVVKVLRTDQKIMLNDYETMVFPLKNAKPREIRNVFRVVTGIEGGRAESIQDKVSKEFFLQVIAPRYMMPYLREAIAALDVPWVKEYYDGAQDTYYRALHRNVEDVDRIASTYGGDDGFSVIDTANNAVRRYDDPYRSEEYLKAAGIVDIPANQVLLDVKLYEVNANNDTKIGLDFISWKNGPGRNLFQFAFTAFSAEQRAKALTSIFDPFLDARSAAPDTTQQVLDAALTTQYAAANFLLTSNYIDFLQVKGRARLVASQKLLVASSHRATLSTRRDELAIVNNENDLDTVAPDRADPVVIRTVNGRPVATTNTLTLPDPRRRLHYRNAGVVTTELTVTPYVGLQSMELDLDLQIGDLNGVAPSGLPIINTRTVSSTVRLLDGQPYVIAGVRRVTNSKNSGKVPYLGDIPVLGYLFGGETTLKRENRLVVVITPYFILASQKTIAMAPEIKTIEAIADGAGALGLPPNTPGYDQWLLGDLSRMD